MGKPDKPKSLQPKCKPCPFCGNSNIYVGRGGVDCPIEFNGGTWGYLAGCKNILCGAIINGPGLPKDYHKHPGSIAADRPIAIAKTVKLWNRRPSSFDIDSWID